MGDNKNGWQEDGSPYKISEKENLKEKLREQYNVHFDKKDFEDRDDDAIILNRLEEIIDIYSLSRTKLAEKLDMSESYVSNVLRGSRKVTEPFIRNVARKTGVSYKWLLTGRGPMLMNDSFAIVQHLATINAKIQYEDSRFLDYLFSHPFEERLVFYKFFKSL